MAKSETLVNSKKIKLHEGLGLACAVHCLSMPIILAVTPGTLAQLISHPLAESILLIVSGFFLAYTFAKDFRSHRHLVPMLVATLGFSLMILHHVIEHDHEQIWLSLAGASVLLLAFFLNWRSRKNCAACQCTITDPQSAV
jgi:LPXTG-motif cell wall-anchored protein